LGGFLLRFFILICLVFSFFSKAENTQLTPEAKKLHYVFVGGLFGDYSPTYFWPLLKELKELGVYQDNIHVLQPRSEKSNHENTLWLYSQLEKIPAPWILIGHSMGGAILANYFFTFPEKLSQAYSVLYMLAAFGGSPMADMHFHKKPLVEANDYQTRWWKRIHQGSRWMLSSFEKALWDLTREESQARQTRWKVVESQLQKENTKKWLAIYSKVDPSRAGYLSFTNQLMQSLYGDNDGVVLTTDQTLASIEKTLILSNHFDMGFYWPMSQLGKKLRRENFHHMLIRARLACARALIES